MTQKHRKYDWTAIRAFYESGHSARECRESFAISKGAWFHAVKRGDLVLQERDSPKPPSATRREVERLLDDGLSQAEIATRLGVSRPTVCFHARQLGVPARAELAHRYDWEQIRAFYEAEHSLRECLRHFGFSRTAWADAVARGAITPRPRLEPIDRVLAAGRRRNRFHVKGRLLLAELKEPRCEECGLETWRSRPIALELHHVNGDGHDNRLENLKLLCPNCHSQTETWGGRNKGPRRGDEAGRQPAAGTPVRGRAAGP